MTYRKGKKSIRAVAKDNKISEAEVSKSMQEAINAAWSSDNLESRSLQRMLFPEGKPTPEHFIEKMAEYTRQQHDK